jgi:threonine synthase
MIFSADRPVNTCTNCGSMLGCVYDYEKTKEWFVPTSVASREKSLWRYREVLPVLDQENVCTLGEGFTPLLRLRDGTLMKDDGQIPTGTFKARGMAVAVSRAKELGLKKLVVPSAGNAGAALACYAARAGLTARVFVPRETPELIIRECRVYGAEVILVEGNIGDAGAKMREDVGGYFDMSTLKEPYRLEGKKTMGYEIAEQTGFELPDVILYPTGGGTGLIGMWKAFDEMEKLGWMGQTRPRMYAVQSDACAPVVSAFSSGKDTTDPSFPDGNTVAAGLRVPRPFAGREILEVLRASKGGAVSVPEKEIMESVRSLAKEGVFACPEGAATFAGYRRLVDIGTIDRGERVLLYNTGTGLKYLNLFT